MRATQEQNAPKYLWAWWKQKNLLEKLQKGEEATFGQSLTQQLSQS